MARVVELKSDACPPALVQHALVIASAKHPPSGTSCLEQGSSRTYFANDSDADIAVMVGRARVWADARPPSIVYLRRES
jgi:hypothetical protein